MQSELEDIIFNQRQCTGFVQSDTLANDIKSFQAEFHVFMIVLTLTLYGV